MWNVNLIVLLKGTSTAQWHSHYVCQTPNDRVGTWTCNLSVTNSSNVPTIGMKCSSFHFYIIVLSQQPITESDSIGISWWSFNFLSSFFLLHLSDTESFGLICWLFHFFILLLSPQVPGFEQEILKIFLDRSETWFNVLFLVFFKSYFKLKTFFFWLIRNFWRNNFN